jgi:serine/threonine protein kinase
MKVAKAKKEADLLFYEYTLLCHHFNNNASFPALLPVISQSYQRTTKETYLVLEYFEETLKQRSLRQELSEQQIKLYGLQILDIIEYIHR